jgi:isoquinoline 1-oxidoreductase beta subunit
VKRRAFIAGGLTVSFAAGLAGCALPVIPKRPAPEPGDALGWVRHEGGGRFVLFIPRAELGQQVLTAFKQIACQELGVAWNAVEARLPATVDIPRVRATVGSDSMRDFALPLAQACATLREALAAGQGSGRLHARAWPVSALRSMRGGGPFVGRGVAMEQGRALVTGAPLFAADVNRPGLLYGRVLRAPVSPELASSAESVDEAAARRVPGFVAFVRDPGFVLGNSEGLGIVARTPAALDRVAAALNPRWRVEGRFEPADIDRAIDIDAPGRRLPHGLLDDRIDTAAPWDVVLRVDIPLAAHAAIEPRAAVAEFDAARGTLALWVGTQDPFYMADVVARRLGLDVDRVTVHACRVGGAFGGKTLCTVELEAALLARAAGAPVKIQWSREQELRQAFHRPPSSHRLRARLRGGRLADWQHGFASSHILLTSAALAPWMQAVAGFFGDNGVARGAAPPYAAQRRRVAYATERLPVFTGPWRGLGAGPNGFAIESMIDACAQHARADPLDFRLAHLEGEPRLARVLRRCAAAAGWGRALAVAASGQSRGRGIACGVYKGNAFATVVAEVTVEAASGQVRVTRLVCAHDCGLVINPDAVRAQCEGNLVWGLAMVLGEQLPLADSSVAGSIAALNLPRLADVPPMQVELVDEGDAPGGAGETAIVAAAAAIANAIHAATGVRVARLPLQPELLRRADG